MHAPCGDASPAAAQVRTAAGVAAGNNNEGEVAAIPCPASRSSNALGFGLADGICAKRWRGRRGWRRLGLVRFGRLLLLQLLLLLLLGSPLLLGARLGIRGQ